MRIIKVKNYDEVSVKTANLILGQVNLKPEDRKSTRLNSSHP